MEELSIIVETDNASGALDGTRVGVLEGYEFTCGSVHLTLADGGIRGRARVRLTVRGQRASYEFL